MFFNDEKPYLKETVYLEKGDQLVAYAQSRASRLYILLYDLAAGKYIRASDDSIWQSPYYRCTLTQVIPRSDSFSIMIAGEADPDANEEGWTRSEVDTPRIDYTITAYRKSADNPAATWDLRQRLSYLCNHWTSGFRVMPKLANEEQKKSQKGVREYFPQAPVTILDSMGASLQTLNYGKTLVYFQFTPDLPYTRAKAIYDKLQAQLKGVTDKSEIQTFKDGARRIKELATTYFSLKIPANKVPVDYYLIDDAGKGYKYLPINLFLFGTKEEAKVLVVMGEIGSDIYDIGW